MIVNDQKNETTTDTETGAELKLVETHGQSAHFGFQISHGGTEIRFSTSKSKEVFGSELLKIGYKIIGIEFVGVPNKTVEYKNLIISLLEGFQDIYGFRDDLVDKIIVNVSFSEKSKKTMSFWESHSV